jgi:hypothetical protein
MNEQRSLLVFQKEKEGIGRLHVIHIQYYLVWNQSDCLITRPVLRPTMPLPLPVTEATVRAFR